MKLIVKQSVTWSNLVDAARHLTPASWLLSHPTRSWRHRAAYNCPQEKKPAPGRGAGWGDKQHTPCMARSKDVGFLYLCISLEEGLKEKKAVCMPVPHACCDPSRCPGTPGTHVQLPCKEVTATLKPHCRVEALIGMLVTKGMGTARTMDFFPNLASGVSLPRTMVPASLPG